MEIETQRDYMTYEWLIIQDIYSGSSNSILHKLAPSRAKQSKAKGIDEGRSPFSAGERGISTAGWMLTTCSPWLCSPASRATTNPWSFKTSLTVPLSVHSLSLWQRIVKWEKPWNQTSGTWIPVFALLWTYCVTLSRSFSTFSTFIYSSACWEHEINE